jgi:hypothetical protein
MRSLEKHQNDGLQCVQLSELRMKFDNAIRNGSSFRDAKKIYMRIKILKKYINSINVE